MGGIDKFLDVSINESGPMLKMEPEDYDENAIDYDDYYEDDDQTLQDYTGLVALHNNLWYFFILKKINDVKGEGLRNLWRQYRRLLLYDNFLICDFASIRFTKINNSRSS